VSRGRFGKERARIASKSQSHDPEGEFLMSRRLHLILLAGALISLALASDDATARIRSYPDLDAVDGYIERQMAANRVPGLALAITRGDEVVYIKGYGTAGNGEPMTPRTQFYTASLSKGFTALAVMQLVEEGKVELDEPVRTYVPGFATADRRLSGKITVRELLNQTSGLADSGFPAYTLPQPDGLEERVETLRIAKLVSEPGAEFHYTDPNYAVLARLVEVASGEPFGGYLRNHVFGPLEMADTTSVLTAEEAPRAAPDLAQGHALAFGVPIERGEMDGFLGGSGGVISTVGDMANYLIMQNNRGRFGNAHLVSPESVALMHTPPRGIESSYAMGWTAPDGTEPRVVEHNGVISAFHADAALLPDEEYGVVLLYNHSYALADYEGIKDGLLDLLEGKRPDAGGLGAGAIGIILATLALLSTTLQVRGLLRLPGWATKTKGTPVWRLAPGIAWRFVPAALLLGLQPLVASFTDRVFSYPQLFWAMPDVVAWLMLGAALGGAAGAARVLTVVRRTSAGKRSGAKGG
jgi:CubicO group peptidase (beta-lactamase class C family)